MVPNNLEGSASQVSIEMMEVNWDKYFYAITMEVKNL